MKRRLIENPAVREQIERAVASQRAFEIRHAELWQLIDPTETIAALKEVIRTSCDDGEIREASKRIAELEGQGSQEASNRARSILRGAFDIHANVAGDLLDAAELGVAELEAEAIEAEREFFSRFDLEREATGVSARVAGLREAVKGFRAKLSLLRERAWETPTRNCLSTVIQWFNPAS